MNETNSAGTTANSEKPRPQLSRAAVGYVDILGYTQVIEESFKEGRGNDELAKLRRAWDDSFSLQWHKSSDVHSVRIRFFTDNIVVASNMSPDRIWMDQASRFLTFAKRLLIPGFFAL